MARRVKNNFEFSEEFKNELLAKLFEDGYASGTDLMQRTKYIGYCGLVPLEVSFTDFAMDICRLDKLQRGGTRKRLMCDILGDVFGRYFEDIEDMSEEDFNQDLQAKVIFFNHGVSLVFRRKEKESAA